jgi:methylthioribose-1-phosphate isomerase
MYLALLNYLPAENPTRYLHQKAIDLKSARPTAVNLSYAVDKSLQAILSRVGIREMTEMALQVAEDFRKEEIRSCQKIGEFGLPIIERVAKQKKNSPVNILTHCNAGWLACIDYGTATAPIYLAHDKGIKVHVWVDETRPRNQGARLTAWELSQHGVPHTLITDNAGGLLMQQGKVDLVIVGSDRTTISGNVVNKIGTYLKALAAYDNNVPFYVALPSSSIDPISREGYDKIPIEERSGKEVKWVEGLSDSGLEKVRICPEESKIVNPGFDITPARLVTGLITEKGVCKTNREEILRLFPGLSG